MTTRDESATSRPDPDPAAVMNERHRLINVAYRLLGSLAEAEDVVQETYARWYAMSPHQRHAIDRPAAWLTRVAGRVSLDQLGSARSRRERYVGEWIPEPLPDRTESGDGRSGNGAADPAEKVTLDQSVTMAFLVVLEAMKPAERVAFVLHDVFGYPFAEVAETVGRTQAACRQLASSARRRLRTSQGATSPESRQAGIVRNFKQAWQARDIDALIAVLDPDATAVSDGGGIVTAAPHPITGSRRVARFLTDIADTAAELTILERTVNGQPGLVVQQGGVTVTVMAFALVGRRISRVWAVRNPEKLRTWTTS